MSKEAPHFDQEAMVALSNIIRLNSPEDSGHILIVTDEKADKTLVAAGNMSTRGVIDALVNLLIRVSDPETIIHYIKQHPFDNPNLN